MKSICKYLSVSIISGSLCMLLNFSAYAQHNQNNSGNRPAPTAVSTPPPAPRATPAPQRTYSPPPQRSYTQPAQRTYSPHVQQRNYNIQRQNNAQRNVTSQRPQQYSGHVIVTGKTNITTQPYQGHVYNHVQGNVNTYHGVWSSNGHYHYNRGYYGSYYAPRLGFSVGFLPYGYYPFYFDDYQYFYSDGLFYQYDNNEYTVVEPPVGAEVSSLPDNAQSIVINGEQYYEVNGVYYEPITKDDGTLCYQVAGKDGELNTDNATVDDNAPAPLQIGDMVDTLPPDCKKININGEKLFVSPDGVYYKAQLDQDSNVVYKVVGLPADDDQGQQDQGGN